MVELVKDEVKEVRRQQRDNKMMKKNFAKGARAVGGGQGGSGRPQGKQSGGGPRGGGQQKRN